MIVLSTDGQERVLYKWEIDGIPLSDCIDHGIFGSSLSHFVAVCLSTGRHNIFLEPQVESRMPLPSSALSILVDDWTTGHSIGEFIFRDGSQDYHFEFDIPDCQRVEITVRLPNLSEKFNTPVSHNASWSIHPHPLGGLHDQSGPLLTNGHHSRSLCLFPGSYRIQATADEKNGWHGGTIHVVLEGPRQHLLPLSVIREERFSTSFTVPKLTFPRGKYCLPKSAEGCPIGWSAGHRKWDTVDFISNNYWSKLSPEGEKTHSSISMDFCCKMFEEGLQWPQGSYCVARFGGECPEGFEKDGKSYVWIDEKNNNANIWFGYIPDGYHHSFITEMFFCCRSDDAKMIPGRDFSTRAPFWILRNGGKCPFESDTSVASLSNAHSSTTRDRSNPSAITNDQHNMYHNRHALNSALQINSAMIPGFIYWDEDEGSFTPEFKNNPDLPDDLQGCDDLSNNPSSSALIHMCFSPNKAILRDIRALTAQMRSIEAQIPIESVNQDSTSERDALLTQQTCAQQIKQEAIQHNIPNAKILSRAISMFVTRSNEWYKSTCQGTTQIDWGIDVSVAEKAGIRVGFSLPLRSIVNCIARQDETNEFSQWLNVHSLLSPNSGLTTKSDFNQRHKHADSFHSSERKQDIVQNMISSDRAIIELLKSRIGSKIAWWLRPIQDVFGQAEDLKVYIATLFHSLLLQTFVDPCLHSSYWTNFLNLGIHLQSSQSNPAISLRIPSKFSRSQQCHEVDTNFWQLLHHPLSPESPIWQHNQREFHQVLSPLGIGYREWHDYSFERMNQVMQYWISSINHSLTREEYLLIMHAFWTGKIGAQATLGSSKSLVEFGTTLPLELINNLNCSEGKNCTFLPSLLESLVTLAKDDNSNITEHTIIVDELLYQIKNMQTNLVLSSFSIAWPFTVGVQFKLDQTQDISKDNLPKSIESVLQVLHLNSSWALQGLWESSLNNFTNESRGYTPTCKSTTQIQSQLINLLELTSRIESGEQMSESVMIQGKTSKRLSVEKLVELSQSGEIDGMKGKLVDGIDPFNIDHLQHIRLIAQKKQSLAPNRHECKVTRCKWQLESCANENLEFQSPKSESQSNSRNGWSKDAVARPGRILIGLYCGWFGCG